MSDASSLLVSIALVASALLSPASSRAQPARESSPTSRGDEALSDALDLQLTETRFRRARVLRVTGATLMIGSIATLGAVMLVGNYTAGAEDFAQSTGFSRGIHWGIGTSLGAGPAFVLGTVLVTAGGALRRRERRRVSVTAQGAGLRLTF
jgi:hypothetical protein